MSSGEKLSTHTRVMANLQRWAEKRKGIINMSDFKRGERVLVWDDRYDKARDRIFLAEVEGARYPFVAVDGLDEDNFNSGEPFYVTHWENAEKIKPKPKLEIDARVLVRNSRDEPYSLNRHFSGWTDDGEMLCFADGKTSWSTRYTSPWKHYELP